MKRFTKVVENFTCENCGFEVKGDGYTNHCPECLYSKHVDRDNPGDRLAKCHGMMKPIAISLKAGQADKIVFECLKCAKTCTNKIAKNDNYDAILALPLGE